ncbi:spore germination protein KB [Paenibacillaceae bacterium GAS479]|nr:spore germination protein KB [Paenibacillaceae bacterium GAS479]
MHKTNKNLISARQFKIIIIFSVIGDTILILPSIVGGAARQDAWISMLLALTGGLLVGWLFSSMGGRQAGLSVIGAAKRLGGKWVGGLIGLVHVFFFYLLAISLLMEISFFMKTQLMSDTPSEAIVLTFLIVITAGMRYGVVSFARMSELLFPIFIAMFLFLTLCLLPQVNLHYITPIASNGLGPIMKGAYPAFTFGFLEAAGILMLVPYLNGGQKAINRSIRDGFFIGWSILFITVLLCVLVLGPDMMEKKYFPTFLLAQRIEIGGFLERVEAVLAFLWIVTVFYKTILYGYSMMRGLAEILNLKEEHFLAMPLALLMLAGTQINVPSAAKYNEILSIAPNYDVTAYLIFPFLQYLLLGLPGFKKNRRPGNNSQGSEQGSNNLREKEEGKT